MSSELRSRSRGRQHHSSEPRHRQHDDHWEIKQWLKKHCLSGDICDKLVSAGASTMEDLKLLSVKEQESLAKRFNLGIIMEKKFLNALQQFVDQREPETFVEQNNGNEYEIVNQINVYSNCACYDSHENVSKSNINKIKPKHSDSIKPSKVNNAEEKSDISASDRYWQQFEQTARNEISINSGSKSFSPLSYSKRCVLAKELYFSYLKMDNNPQMDPRDCYPRSKPVTRKRQLMLMLVILDCALFDIVLFNSTNEKDLLNQCLAKLKELKKDKKWVNDELVRKNTKLKFLFHWYWCTFRSFWNSHEMMAK